MINNPTFKELQLDENSEEDAFTYEVLRDYYICCVSREVSVLGRKEVLTGKAKFGILGDGKELPQIAMARAFKEGDFRSGYYRDQTFMFAAGLGTVQGYFAQLYADVKNDPFSGGRQMNAHFASPLIDENGDWIDHTTRKNVSSDISSTAGQMARALGIATASKKYRENPDLPSANFSDKGNEVSFVTIGDASTSEGVFWETINAAAVTQVPLAVCVWDDGYGISVPKKLQTAKGSISEVLSGFINDDKPGIEIYTVKGWDYTALIEVFEKGIARSREHHIPLLIHVEECTQPQGHSTSGSHERYKSEERLNWEKEYDCITKFEEWIVETGVATSSSLKKIRTQAIEYARAEKDIAWEKSRQQIDPLIEELNSFVSKTTELIPDNAILLSVKDEIKISQNLQEAEVVSLVRKLRIALSNTDSALLNEINDWITNRLNISSEKYHTHLYSEGSGKALDVPVVHIEYEDDAKSLPGHKLLNRFFDQKLESYPEIFAFGEDVGKIGDVNQGFAGLQDKFSKSRVFDVGIREWTIIGQAIGMSMRGIRPIAEIQYLDYLIYAISALSDDLSTVRYRSAGIQKAPAIIRTRGHRLEGIWHAGSPMGLLLSSLRGMYIAVPRDMTRAAGFYNTLLKSDDPGVIIESLNGYRLREKLPSNLGDYTIPLGVPEVLTEGDDITIVTYGSMVRVVETASEVLSSLGVSVEVIDAQTLIPFDLENVCLESIKKTNRLLIVDEDLPGAGAAYILNDIIERQNAYYYLDSKPMTLTAHSHRTPFGSDGDYYTKPNEEDIIEKVLNIMREIKPNQYPFPFSR